MARTTILALGMLLHVSLALAQAVPSNGRRTHGVSPGLIAGVVIAGMIVALLLVLCCSICGVFRRRLQYRTGPSAGGVPAQPTGGFMSRMRGKMGYSGYNGRPMQRGMGQMEQGYGRHGYGQQNGFGTAYGNYPAPAMPPPAARGGAYY